MPTRFKTIQTVYLLASWLNLVLYAIEWSLYGVYLYDFPEDRKVHRWIVHTALVNDTVCTAVVCTRAYLLLVLQNTHEFDRIWPVPFITLTNAISSVIVHTFLIYRIYHLHIFNGPMLVWSPTSVIRRLWPVLILCLMTLLQLIFSIMSAVFVASRSNSSRGFGFIAAVISRSIRATLDVLIASCLAYRLNKFETSFLSTKCFIHRVTLKVLGTGMFVAAITVVIIVLTFLNVIVLVVFTSIVGRVYTITMLSHLCSREAVRNDHVLLS